MIWNEIMKIYCTELFVNIYIIWKHYLAIHTISKEFSNWNKISLIRQSVVSFSLKCIWTAAMILIKILKNLSGNISNSFPKFCGDWLYWFWIHWEEADRHTEKTHGFLVSLIFEFHFLFNSKNRNFYISSFCLYFLAFICAIIYYTKY